MNNNLVYWFSGLMNGRPYQGVVEIMIWDMQTKSHVFVAAPGEDPVPQSMCRGEYTGPLIPPWEELEPEPEPEFEPEPELERAPVDEGI